MSESTCDNSTCIFPDYGNFIRPILYREFDRAGPFDCKSVIQQRAIKKIANALNIKDVFENASSSANKTFVHPEISAMIEKLYGQLQESEIKSEPLTMRFNSFKTCVSNFHDNAIVKNLIREFQKCLETTNNNNKNKILRDNRLNVLLAVDGFQGSEPIAYIPNLALGMKEVSKMHERHALGVRLMYRALPEGMTGTTSTYVVRKILLGLYAPSADEDKKVMVNNELETIRDYLVEPPEFEIAEEELEKIYKDNVGDSLETVALEKLTTLWNVLKKKQQQQQQKKETAGAATGETSSSKKRKAAGEKKSSSSSSSSSSTTKTDAKKKKQTKLEINKKKAGTVTFTSEE